MDEARVRQYAYVYHYHAQYQQSPGVIQHVDSIVLRGLPVLTDQDLTELRKAIAAQEGFEDVGRVIISSLTLLSTPQPDESKG